MPGEGLQPLPQPRLIEQDKVKPSWIVSHELPLEQAPEVYKNFDERQDGWTKVTLKPNG